MNLFDEQVVSDNVLDDAIRFAQLIANSPVDARRTSKMQVKDSDKAQMLMHGNKFNLCRVCKMRGYICISFRVP